MLFLRTGHQYGLRDEEIRKAFDIAYLLHPEKLVAWCVTRDGYDRISSIRRLEAKSRGKYKMRTPDEALPQIGIFYGSDVWERNQENEIEKKKPVYEPTANDKIVRYIKFIVMETMHRDSANIAVGLGSLLYTYSPSEICRIAPDLFDDDNIRRDKKRIADRIKKRFGDGEDVIILKPAVKLESALTIETLKMIAPWVQSHLSFANQAINLLETYFYVRTAPLDWNRNHILVDPECGGLPRLIREFNNQLPTYGDDMKLDEPEKKLSVPSFKSGRSNENNRFSPPTLTSYDMHTIRESVRKNRRRRKSFVSSRIRVCVDGKEIMQFDACDSDSRPLSISSTSSYVEVFGQDEFGDLLLAFFPLLSLNCFDSKEPSAFKIQVEGRKMIHCKIVPETDADGGVVSGLLRVN